MTADYDLLNLLTAAALGFAIAWALTWWVGRRRLMAVQHDARERLEEARQDVVRLTEESAAARTRAELVPAMQNALHAREGQLVELQRQLADATQRGARLETIIRRDRQAMREKLAFMEDWQARMGDAYKALSAASLRENNQVFLDLAQSALARQLDAARSDLTQRSQAVETMLQPIREALARYDHQVLSLERARERPMGSLASSCRPWQPPRTSSARKPASW